MRAKFEDLTSSQRSYKLTRWKLCVALRIFTGFGWNQCFFVALILLNYIFFSSHYTNHWVRQTAVFLPAIRPVIRQDVYVPECFLLSFFFNGLIASPTSTILCAKCQKPVSGLCETAMKALWYFGSNKENARGPPPSPPSRKMCEGGPGRSLYLNHDFSFNLDRCSIQYVMRFLTTNT